MTLKPLHEEIADIRYTGEHPLLQYDLLDCRLLLRSLIGNYPLLNSRRLGRILKEMEMRCLGLVSVCGRQCYLWTCLPPQPRADIVKLARERMETNATELHTEILIGSGLPVPPAAYWSLLTPLEEKVLKLRLDYYPPRKIAQELEVFPHVVYKVSQQLQKKLGVVSLADVKMLRRRAQEEGLIPLTMEDF